MMCKSLFATAVAAAALVAINPVSATTLIVDSGWQDDTLEEAGVPTDNSPWTFTVDTGAVLSVTDYFIPGDIFTLTGDVSGVTTFFAGSPTDVQATGTYGPAWTDASYSKIAIDVGPGTYTFSITGDGAGGTPAGLGVRLDTLQDEGAVPEPSSWAMMLAGFGLSGTALRMRARTSRLQAV